MAITNGPNLNSVASPQKHTMAGNYVDLASSGWAELLVSMVPFDQFDGAIIISQNEPGPILQSSVWISRPV